MTHRVGALRIGVGGVGAGRHKAVRTAPLTHAQLRFWLWHEQCPPGTKGLLNATEVW
ncbi:MAG: hypothetical protein QOJ33_1266, partial [Chloroflexota bacterium]|nr:hypothetical protein [Chloroflexota bacterium]